MVEIRMLGPVEVVDGGVAMNLSGARQSRVLVALWVAGRTLTYDELADRVFDGAQPDDPVRALRTSVRRIRRAIGDGVVETHQGGYRLTPSAIGSDIDSFEELVAAGRRSQDPAAGRRSLRQALDLWRGAPFGDLGELEWLAPERLRLEELHLAALEAWYELHLTDGRVTEILPSLEASVAEHPLRDQFQRQLMLALHRSGRQADALRAAHAYREVLGEAGLEPSPEAVALEQRIATRDESLFPTTGRPLRGYRLHERLGEGAFSIVWRGTQPSVDRDVAIKQIRSELANRPAFIRRFEAEAQMVAHLEHPFIVPLYDYWREPDSAFLVMRWLRGGTLDAAIFASRLDLDATVTMVTEVGSALAVAHHHGVIHRDVKPANVFLDGEGHYYLGDFGIALEATEIHDPEAALSAGSPAYAAPEQLRREEVGPEADVHGLGIVIYEALTGELPFPDERTQAGLLQRQLHEPLPAARSRRPDLPDAVDDVIQRATAKSPADRFRSVEELVGAFTAAADGSGSPGTSPRPAGILTLVGDGVNPYKGLRPFLESDADDFFGRDRLVDRLLAQLAVDGPEGRFVAVVGPSGSGKSSVVRAGLLPAVRAGRLAGSNEWLVASMVPSARPFEELEAALMRVAATPVPGLVEMMTGSARGVARAVNAVLSEEAGELLLLVDQFEELFTMAGEDERRLFIEGLHGAVTGPRPRLRVLATVRADFWDRPLRYPGLAQILETSAVTVTPLAADELERAIVDPAARVGCEFEPGLVSRIVADVSDQPGALPMLQYALTELYERRVSGLLTADAYEDLGGVTGALARRAEELYEGSTGEQQEGIRRLFTRLVTPGEGTEDTRRRVRRSELETVPDEVIDRFGQARLLSFDRDEASREPTVEVAHEALIREWPRLRGWLDDDRDGLRIHRHLTAAAVAWDRAARDDGELYRGGRLESVEGWLAIHPTDPTPVEREFVERSVAAREAQRQKERRENRRLRRLLTVVGVVAVIALIAGAVAFAQQREAADQRNRAESEAVAASEAGDRAEDARRDSDIRRLVAESGNQADADRRLALLMALEAHQRDPSAETLGAIQRALVRSPRNWWGTLSGAEPYVRAQFLGGNRLAAMSTSGLDVWDIGARVLERTVALPPDPVSLAVAADRQTVGIGHQDGGWEVLSTEDFSEIESGDAGDRVSAIALNEDGSRLAIGTAGGTVTIHHVPTSEPPVEIERGVEVQDLTFRPGEPLLAIGTGYFGSALVVDVATGELGPELALGPEDVQGADVIAWHDRGLLVGNQEELVIADPRSGAIVGELSSVDRLGGLGVTDTASGSVALTGADGTVELLAPGAVELTPIGSDPHVGGILSIALDPAGRLAAIVGSNGVSLLTTDGTGTLATATLPTADIHVTLTEDGRTALASDPARAPISVWDLADASAPAEAFEFFHFSQSGDAFVFVRPDPEGGVQAGVQAALWKDGSFTPLAPRHTFFSVGLSPDEQIVVVSTVFGTLEVFDTRSGRLITTLDAVQQEAPTLVALAQFATDLEFTPDGEILVVAVYNGAVYRYDTETWQQVGERLAPDAGFHGIDFTSDGSMAATLHWEQGMQLRRGTDLALLQGPVPATNVRGVGGQNPDILAGDRYAVTGGAPGGATLWDLETLTPVGDPFPHVTDFRHPSLAADAKLLATTTGTEAVIWNVDVETWPDIACRAAGRNMTAAEWEELGPQGAPYHATCAQWPALG